MKTVIWCAIVRTHAPGTTQILSDPNECVMDRIKAIVLNSPETSRRQLMLRGSGIGDV
jgi:hypothetical protein